MTDFDFSDINLDFLQSTPPRVPQVTTRTLTPIIKHELDIGHHVTGTRKKNSKKRLEWAKRIATVDGLQREIQVLKADKLELQAQLKDFQKSALAIQNLYTTEKASSDEKSRLLKDLQEKFERADADLVIKNLKCDQLEAQFADHKERPVDYNVLAVKFLRLFNKLDEEDGLRNYLDRSLVDDLRQYCAKYKIKVPQALSPKKHKSKTVNLQKEDIGVQCDLKSEIPAVVKPIMHCQSTQCQVDMRSQATQHISTMTTRGTTTACFIQFRSVGTNTTDLQPLPVIDDILKEFAPWQNITPITPLVDQPTSGKSQEGSKSFKTIGTCTWLCNVRRAIDFIPRNRCQRLQTLRPMSSCEGSTSQSIKQEVPTPSPSPTPNVQATVVSNQNDTTTVPQSTPAAATNQVTASNSLLNSLHTSLPLRQLPGSSFDDLWNIFGRMILGLLQTSNAGIATNTTTLSSITNQEAVNQYQFQSWLRDLYETSVIASTNVNSRQSEVITTHNVATSPLHSNEMSPLTVSTNFSPSSSTLVPEESEAIASHNVATSPLHFNEMSPFSSTNIVRPQARRSYANDFADNNEISVVLDSDYQEDVPTQDDLMLSTNSCLIDTSLSPNLATTEKKITYCHLPPQNPSSNLNEKITKHSKTAKKKNNILKDFQQLFPEAKLNKSKEKALKRLLKSKKHKRKTSLKGVSNQNEESFTDRGSQNVETEEETAVDFLKGIFENCNNDAAGGILDSEESSKLYRITATSMANQAEKDKPHQLRKVYSFKNKEKLVVEAEDIHNTEIAVGKNVIIPDVINNSNLPAPQVNLHSQICLTNNIEESSSQFKKPNNVSNNFSFVKPSGVYKKSNISNKKALYTSLFGDSDTEMEEFEDDPDGANVKPKNSSPTEEVKNSTLETSHTKLKESDDEDDISCTTSKLDQTFTQRCTDFSEDVILSDEDKSEDNAQNEMNSKFSEDLSPTEQMCSRQTECNVDKLTMLETGNILTMPNDYVDTSVLEYDQATPEGLNYPKVIKRIVNRNEILDSTIDITNCLRDESCSGQNEANVYVTAHISDTSLTQNSTLDHIPKDFFQHNESSIPAIIAPVFENIEKSKSTMQTSLLFDQMDKETQKRLETIIDSQLEKLPPHNDEDENVKQTIEELPSDFEKDFELSSEEDVNEILPNTAEIDCINSPYIVSSDANERIKESNDGNGYVNVKLSEPNEDLVLTARESISETKSFPLKKPLSTSINFVKQPSCNKSSQNCLVYNQNDKANINKVADEFATENNNDVNLIEKEQSKSGTKQFTECLINMSDKYDSTSSSEEEIIEISSDITSLIDNSSKVVNEKKTPPKESVCTSKEIINISDDYENLKDGSLEKDRSKELPSTVFSEREENNADLPNGHLNMIIKCTPHVATNPNEYELNSDTVKVQTAHLHQEGEKHDNYLNKGVLNISPIHKPNKAEILVEFNSIHLPNSLKIITKSQATSCTDNEISALEISSDFTNVESSRGEATNTPIDELIIDEPADDSDQEIVENSQDQKEASVQQIAAVPSNNATPKLFGNLVKCHRQTPKTHVTNYKTDLSTLNDHDNLNTSTEISSILNSTLCKEIFTDSMSNLVNEVLREGEPILTSLTTDKKPLSRGRKRKSECQLEEQQPPCKRSERLKAKKIIMEQSFDISVTPIEIGKYTRVNNRCNTKSEFIERHLKKQLATSEETKETKNMLDVPLIKMGFFREISDSKAKLDGVPSSSLKVMQKEEENCNRLEIKLNKLPAPPDNPRQPKSCESVNIGSTIKETNTTSSNNNHSHNFNTPLHIETNNFLNNCPESSGKTNAANVTNVDFPDSPLSPLYDDTIENILNTTTLDIALELSPECRPKCHQKSLLETLVDNYSPGHFIRISKNSKCQDAPTKRQGAIIKHYEKILEEYCSNAMELDPDIMATNAVGTLAQYSMQSPLLCNVILKLAKDAKPSNVKNEELPSVIQEMPPRHLSLPLHRLCFLLKHLSCLNATFCQDLLEKIESFLFNDQQAERATINGNLHLTQLYLMACKLHQHQLDQHPARMFIAKCLYFYAIQSVSMIHEVLLWYPTTLPPKEDRTYDRSDALITVIQQILMNTKYDMGNTEVRGRLLISKLRYEYHYMPYMPTMEEVLYNLVEKLKMSKFNNICWSFSLMCKRLYPTTTERIVLQQHLLPLANEYFNEALNNPSCDTRLTFVLDIISMIVKTFPQDWDVEVYLNLFSRFLNNISRDVIQETAVCCILRLQRFGYVNCFNRLRCFKPTFELAPHTQAMFKTFIHRKPLNFLQTIATQNAVNFS